MELQRLRSPVRSSAIGSYGFSSFRRHGDWHSSRALFSLRILIPFCGDAHRHCDTFTRREMRCCTIDVGSHTSCIWDGVHHGTLASGQHTPVLRQIFSFGFLWLFPLSSFVYFSERVFGFFVFAYSWPGHITLESQPHGYEEGGHVCFTLLFFLFFNVVTMGCFFSGVGLRRRSGSNAYLFRLPNMGGSSRWVRHCVSARTIWQRLGSMYEHLRCCVRFLCPTNWSWTQVASKRRSVLQAIRLWRVVSVHVGRIFCLQKHHVCGLGCPFVRLLSELNWSWGIGHHPINLVQE